MVANLGSNKSDLLSSTVTASGSSSWWWQTTTSGLSFLPRATFTYTASLFWGTREGVPTAKSSSSSSSSSYDRHGNVRSSIFWKERWISLRQKLFTQFESPEVLLALGVGGCALMLQPLNREYQRTTQWLVWGSGLMVIRAMQQQEQQQQQQQHSQILSDTEKARDERQGILASQLPTDSAWWLLIFLALFPIPERVTRRSDGLGPWLVACMLGVVGAWRGVNQSVNRNNNNKSADFFGMGESHSAKREETNEISKAKSAEMGEDIFEGNEERPHYNLSLPPRAPKVKKPPSPPSADTKIPNAESLDTALKKLLALNSIAPVIDSTATSVSLPKAGRKRYLEILLHNISHTDLVLSLDAPQDAASSVSSIEEDGEEEEEEEAQAAETLGNKHRQDPYCLCRPRFSCFDHYCRAVLDRLNGEETIVGFPRYQRSSDHPRYSILSEPTNGYIPTGLSLCSETQVVADLGEVRLRGRDHGKLFPNNGEPIMSEIGNSEESKIPISYVFFPLLATLLPCWEKQILEKYLLPGSVKRVLILVTGVGTPRNWTHSVRGNSTQACADLMEHFLQRLDPDLVVVKIHSETNIFRYDDNLVFVQQELMPVINAYRDAHARGMPYPDEPPNSLLDNTNKPGFDVDWRQSLSVTLSFADGSSARTYAIQAGLRQYRPTFFHFWQLKTFWHESKIVDDDIEVYPFEAMETSPAMDAHHITDAQLQRVVDEMMKFKNEMVASLKNDNDIMKFWLRKSQKPVLAVLLVQRADGQSSILYRGTNMEVSMPTGSLCAERNVIGTALADNPNLKREQLKMIAVLAVPLPSQNDTPISNIPVPSASASTAAVVGYDDNGGLSVSGLKRMNSTASFGGSTIAGSITDLTHAGDRKTSIGSETDDWVGMYSTSQLQQPNVEIAFNTETGTVKDSGPLGLTTTIVPTRDDATGPVRKIALYSSSHSSSKSGPAAATDATRPQGQKKSPNRRRTLVIVQSNRDLNPLAPCGACNEWLKKIAECNPYFQVVTFTDSNCNGVYCRSLPL
ncbi:hypothetical protein ACA910_016662 [Epithemia clementina (nom. ined.)]